jgi:DNA-directed RNA polymerase subunit RPC12/RpoP
MEHFSKEYSPDILNYAKDKIFRKYIFVRIKHLKTGKKRVGYCTYCGKEFPAYDMKHKTVRACPACGNECTIVHDWRGHSKMIDEAYFVYYERSVIQPSVIVARGIYGIKDYRGEFRNVKTQLADENRYIFDMGNPVMYKRYAYYSTWDGKNRIETGSF